MHHWQKNSILFHTSQISILFWNLCFPLSWYFIIFSGRLHLIILLIDFAVVVLYVQALVLLCVHVRWIGQHVHNSTGCLFEGERGRNHKLGAHFSKKLFVSAHQELATLCCRTGFCWCMRACAYLCAYLCALLSSLSCASPFMLDLARMPPARLVEGSSAGFTRSWIFIAVLAKRRRIKYSFFFLSLPDSPTKPCASPPSSVLNLTFDKNVKPSAGTFLHRAEPFRVFSSVNVRQRHSCVVTSSCFKGLLTVQCFRSLGIPAWALACRPGTHGVLKWHWI